eukprot:m.90085 g.90085  ORF g.90085 m.90085 type:complete len:743 (+) comp13255_c0_seq6:75-2303(+)
MANPLATAGPQNFSFNQTMLRVKDPKKSLDFYTKYFGMTVINKGDYSDFSLYFLVTLPEGQSAPSDVTSEEARAYRKSGKYGCCLELTHNHGTETQEDFSYHNGNSDPRGFGHIGFLVDDVYAKSEELEKDGFEFAKKPDDGNMKGLAFVKDPDGYWVEIIKRSSDSPVTGRPTFQQTMLRVKELEKSVEFYKTHCHMTEVCRIDFPNYKFTLVFMATLTEKEKECMPAPDSEAAQAKLWSLPGTTLELTYNYGTDKDADFEGYDNGNKEPKRGFGHVAFMVDDVYAASEALEKAGCKFQKKPDEGKMKGLAFVLDPDGYWVELVKREVAETEAATTGGDEASAVDIDEVEPLDRTLSVLITQDDAKDQVLKTGFLNKEGGRIKSWKKRYFVLTPSALAYYSEQRRMESDLKGGVLMENIVKAQPADPSTCKKQYAFTILTGERNFQVQASSLEERDSWIQAINDALAAMNPEGLSSASLARENRLMKEEIDRCKALINGRSKPAGDIELIYFDGPGRGELTRLVLNCGNISFKDTRVADWAALKADPDSLPNKLFSVMPILKVGDYSFSESNAITAYAAEIALNSLTLRPEQRAVDNMIKNVHGEIQIKLYKTLFGSDESKAAAKATLPEDLKIVMKGLENACPESGFIHGGETPSLGDLAIFDMFSSKFPGLKACGIDLSSYPKFTVKLKSILPACLIYVCQKCSPLQKLSENIHLSQLIVQKEGFSLRFGSFSYTKTCD